MKNLKETFCWHLEHDVLSRVLSDRAFIRWRFRRKTGYALCLDNPKTFCEKIQWLKFNLKRDDFSIMVDKASAKEYAASIIGREHIIPTIGIWDTVEEVDWNKLPNRFVVKLTSDSGGVVICRDKKALDVEKAKMRLWHKSRDYSKFNKEYPYKGLRHRVIAEELMVNGSDAELKDYKFYCFNGRAEYCQVISDRQKDESIDFYDREWIHQPFIGLNPNVHHAELPIEKPERYAEMLKMADRLADHINHPFVRIDLYNVNGRVYFGEITFFPSSGMGHIRPIEWDKKLGDMIKLPINK